MSDDSITKTVAPSKVGKGEIKKIYGETLQRSQTNRHADRIALGKACAAFLARFDDSKKAKKSLTAALKETADAHKASNGEVGGLAPSDASRWVSMYGLSVVYGSETVCRLPYRVLGVLCKLVENSVLDGTGDEVGILSAEARNAIDPLLAKPGLTADALEEALVKADLLAYAEPRESKGKSDGKGDGTASVEQTISKDGSKVDPNASKIDIFVEVFNDSDFAFLYGPQGRQLNPDQVAKLVKVVVEHLPSGGDRAAFLGYLGKTLEPFTRPAEKTLKEAVDKTRKPTVSVPVAAVAAA